MTVVNLGSIIGPQGERGADGVSIGSGSLSRIELTGDVTGMTKDVSKNVAFKFTSGGKNVDCNAKVNWQGSSSLNYPKKNLTIKLFESGGFTTAKKENFNNWGLNDKYVLKANYIDFSQARNIVSARLWKDILTTRTNLRDELTYSPNFSVIDGFPIELYINGVYSGLYTLNIPKGGWMFGMSSNNLNHAAIVGESNDSGSSTMFTRPAVIDKSDWGLEFPDEVSPAIRASFNRMIAFVGSADEATFKANAYEYLDIDAAIDYYIFAHVITHIDGMAKNFMMLTYDGIKWIPSAYDMDSTFGLHWDGEYIKSSTFPLKEYQANNSALWNKIGSYYPTEIARRYKFLRNTVLNGPNMIRRFEEFISQISPDQYAMDLAANPDIPSQTFSHIRQLRQNVSRRLKYVDSTKLGALLKLPDGADMPTEPVVVDPTGTIIDLFERANSDTLGTPWSDPDGAYRIENGRAVAKILNTGPDARYALIDTTSDSGIITTAALFTGSFQGIILRYKDNDNFVLVDSGWSNTMRVVSKVAGRATLLKEISYETESRTELAISIENDSLKIRKDGEMQSTTILPAIHRGNKKFGLVTSKGSGGDYFEFFKFSPLKGTVAPLFEDLFERPNTTTLGTPWSDPDNTYLIADGRAVSRVITAVDRAATVTMATDNVILTTAGIFTGTFQGIALRYKDNDNFMCLDSGWDNKMRIISKVAGVETNLKDIAYLTGTRTEISIKIENNTITVTKDGVVNSPVTIPAAHRGNNKFGFLATQGGDREIFEYIRIDGIE